MNPNATTGGGSLTFPSLSSTASILLGSGKSSSTGVGFVNRVIDRIDQGSELSDKDLKGYIIMVMEAIVYLGDIREPTNPENITSIISNVLHPEVEISLADVHQALSHGSKKAIFTWSSKNANTWTIDKNINSFKDNHEFVSFYQSLSIDTENRTRKIKQLFDATRRKRNPIVAYSQTFQEGSASGANSEEGLIFSDLGLKDDAFDPASDPGNYVSYHARACLAPTSIHYAARKITLKLLEQAAIVYDDPNKQLSTLERLKKGHENLINSGTTLAQPSTKRQTPSQLMQQGGTGGPTWTSNKFAFEGVRSSGQKPGFLSSFSIVSKR